MISDSPLSVDKEKPPRCVANDPFNSSSADIIIVTADDVEFRVHRSILSIASPFFADMFALAQPEQREDGMTKPADTICISEMSETFEDLLRLCYPIADPVIRTLGQLQLVFEAANKYQMDEARNLTRRMLRQFLDAKPLQTFALACRLGAEEESYLAAAAWKRIYNSRLQSPKKKLIRSTKSPICHQFSSTLISACYVPEMADLPAAIYHRLILFARLPHDTFSSFIQQTVVYPPQQNSATSLSDLSEWPINVADADVVVRSVDGVDFPFHKLLLQLSKFTNLLDSGSTVDLGDGKPPTIQVSVSSQVLRDLLTICLPSVGCEIENTFRLWQVSRVVREYEMTSAISAVKKQVQRKTSTWPLSSYLIASQSGWEAEAAAAARLLTEQTHIEDIYDPILEDIPASTYYSLLRYHHDALAAMTKVMQKYTPTRPEWKGTYTRYPDSWPAYVALPIAGKELERRMQLSATPSRQQRPYDISTLVSENEKMEKEVKDAIANVKLTLPGARQSESARFSPA